MAFIDRRPALPRGAALLAASLLLAVPFGTAQAAQGVQMAQAQPGASTGAEPSLSEKLDRTDGVIAPPDNIDPKIQQVTPSTGGSMPVIPPSAVTPGTPGKPDAVPGSPPAEAK